MSILIKDTVVISQNEKRDIFHGDIYIEGDSIREMAPRLSVEAEYCIDGKNTMAVPGLVNTHTHIPMTLLRGYGDDMLLEEWLKERIWPIEAKLTPRHIKAGASLALAEMIATGTTCFADMYFYEDVLCTVTQEMGLRGYMGFSLIDFDTPEMPQEQLVSACDTFVRKWKNNRLVQPVVAPHSTYSCSPDTLLAALEIAERHGTLLHTHCSETRQEVYDVKEKYGARPVEHLKNLGVLTPATLLAHCGWITKGEAHEIAQAEAKVSHNPVSNMKLATGGFTPLPELLGYQATVGLGTDGAASNNCLDMFQVMKFTALIHKHHRWDPRVTPAQIVLDLATRDGASCLQLKGGSLVEGNLADVILLDLQHPNLIPHHNYPSLLVYSAQGGNVSTTIVNGKPLMVDREFVACDYHQIVTDAQKAAVELTGEI